MATYPFPNWIVPPDVAGNFARGAQLGMEQQRLAMQEQENQRASLMEQQRLEVEKAYRSQQLGLEKQRIDEAQRLNTLKIQDAANRMSAQKAYVDFVNSGGDPTEGLLRFGPAMGETMSGYAGLAKDITAAKHPFVPRTLTLDGQNLFQTSPNQFRFAPQPKVSAAELPKDHLVDGKLIRSFPDGTTKQIYPPPPKEQKDTSNVLSNLIPEIMMRGAAPMAYMGQKPTTPSSSSPTAKKSEKKTLTKELAEDFLKQAKGDKEKARQLAKDAGYDF